MSKWFETGKTYIQNEPYRAPETIGVFKVAWSGLNPQGDLRIAFGFTTEASPGEPFSEIQWRVQLDSISKDRLAKAEDGEFDKAWVEAVWDTSQLNPYWRMKTPEDKVADKLED